MNPPIRFDVLTVHFRDFAWTALLIANVERYVPDEHLGSIFVVDQDRSERSARVLRALSPRVVVLTFEPSEPHMVVGHDHARVLERAMVHTGADALLLFDSDCHPRDARFFPVLREHIAHFDAICALAPWKDGLTHPCFMAFGPAVDRAALSFDEGLFEPPFFDTGRLIGRQLLESGLTVELLGHERPFRGRHGTLYFDGTVYHHGGGSLHLSDDPRLSRQLGWRDKLYRRAVLDGRYELSGSENAYYVLRTAVKRAAGAPSSLRRRLRPDARGMSAPSDRDAVEPAGSGSEPGHSREPGEQGQDRAGSG